MVIIDTLVNTLFGGLTLDPAGMHCPSWDDAFVSSFTLNSSIHDHNTRVRSLLHLSQIHSSYGHKTIHFLGSRLWNALPPDLKELSNTKMFKQKLKIYLLSQ